MDSAGGRPKPPLRQVCNCRDLLRLKVCDGSGGEWCGELRPALQVRGAFGGERNLPCITIVRETPVNGWGAIHCPGDTADADADGLANLLEYAFHLSPKQADPSPISASLGAATWPAEGKRRMSVVRITRASRLTFRRKARS